MQGYTMHHTISCNLNVETSVARRFLPPPPPPRCNSGSLTTAGVVGAETLPAKFL